MTGQHAALGQQAGVGGAHALGATLEVAGQRLRNSSIRRVGPLDDGDEELLLRAEEPHHVGLADAGRAGDLVGGGAHVGLGAEHRGGRLEDELAAIGRLHAREPGRLLRSSCLTCYQSITTLQVIIR